MRPTGGQKELMTTFEREKPMDKTTRCIGIGLAVIVLFFAAGTVLADISPAGCSANNLSVNFSKDQTQIVSGNTVHYTVTISNGGAGGCDVTDTDVVFHCPAADGTPTASNTTLTSTGDFPVSGGGNACWNFDGSLGCNLNAGLACVVTVNAGVTQASARVNVGQIGDITKGALHDSPNNDSFDASKDLAVNIVECLTVAECNDNQFCTDDACVSNVCQHTAHSCPADSDLCTTESCDETADACVSSAPRDCNDNNVCTDDSCVPATGDCSNVFDETNDSSCAPSPGRMTGGGSVFTSTNRSSKTEGRVTHGFELHCDPEIGPNNLEVNWGGNHFHMEELLTAVCTDDPAIEPPPPPVGFDTYDGTGTGRCNGEPGASITFQFTDAGEPGTGDTATINITGCPGGLSLSVSGHLKKGNHQAHRTN
jgi:hypothetical protein